MNTANEHKETFFLKISFFGKEGLRFEFKEKMFYSSLNFKNIETV